MMTDPIADMLTRIRNGGAARHSAVAIGSSKIKRAIARVLHENGYLADVRVEAREGKPVILAELRYEDDGNPLIDGLRRVSRPGRRVYVGAKDVPRVRNGLGIAVISTSKGVLSDAAAREASVGGEILCEVW